MNKSRLEAFSDGVFAIIITIMVLELKIPEDTRWATVKPLAPVFLSYILSFTFIAIYWVNHHHLMHTLKNQHAMRIKQGKFRTNGLLMQEVNIDYCHVTKRAIYQKFR